MSQKIACVTGATGLVGRHVVNQLITAGYQVRVLSRRPYPQTKNIQSFLGSLDNQNVLQAFVQGASAVFHCAGEIRKVELMEAVNVRGTERLLQTLSGIDLAYFCYVSSCSVMGAVDGQLATEETACRPRDHYEKTKWQAEQLVCKAGLNCQTVILRPTRIFDQNKLDPIYFLLYPTFINCLKVIIKGREFAQIVYAHNVAEAALFYLDAPERNKVSVDCYIISQDEDRNMTVSQLWTLLHGTRMPSLPLFIPHYLRRLRRVVSNRGDICYSAKKLLATGFTFSYDIKQALYQVKKQLTNLS